MKNYYCFAFLLTSIFVFSQKTFSPGYYIDQSNIRNEGFIEDTNPYNSPTKINFKTSVDTQSSEITIEKIKEYKINTDYKYIKYKVDYDYDQIINKDELSIFGVEPNLKQKEILLKVLVEGRINLYSAIVDDAIFFYMKDENDQEPILLVHRKYNLQNRIIENNAFRKAIYEKMKSEEYMLKDFLTINYNKKELEALFKNFNQGVGNFIEQNVDIKREQNKFYYKVFAGISSFSTTYSYNGANDLKAKNNFSNPIIGFELSTVFGRNSKRSEVFTKLFYQKVSIVSSHNSSLGNNYILDLTMNSDFSSLNFIGGYRYALIRIGRNQLFIDGSLGISTIIDGDFDLDYKLIYTGLDNDSISIQNYTYNEYNLTFLFNVGIGYKINNRYAINLEYSTPKNYLTQYISLSSGGFSNLNLIFTYTINK